MPVIHNQPPAKPLAQITRFKRMIDPSGLTAHQKQLLWSGLKSIDPDLAAMLKEDKTLDDLKNNFNATIRFTVDDFNRYLQAGLKLLEEKK